MQNMLEIRDSGGWKVEGQAATMQYLSKHPIDAAPSPCYVLFRVLLCKRRVSLSRVSDMNTKSNTVLPPSLRVFACRLSETGPLG